MKRKEAHQHVFLPEVYSAWERFVKRGVLDVAAVRPIIAEGWRRSRELGADPFFSGEVPVLDRAQKLDKTKQNKVLIDNALPFVHDLHELVKGSGFVVVLVDRDGVMLKVIGDCSALQRSGINHVEGACWTEKVMGNTAITISLLEKIQMQVCGEEHYCMKFHEWACSAAPIKDEDGNLIGVINMSGSKELVHPHTLGMVVSAARAIENQIAMKKTQCQLMIKQKHYRAIIENISDGLLIIDQQGKITDLNHIGGRILGIDPREVVGMKISEVVDFQPVVLDVLKTGKSLVDKELFLKIKNNIVHLVKTSIPIRDENGVMVGVVDTFREIKRIHKMINQMVGAQATFTFQDFIGNSVKLRKTLKMAEIAANSSSTILIQGESGTGKEVLAQAIHNASDRSNGPFIALNCAAIPRELLESELFGYEEGAFTGAKRGGRPGKFELAGGGTIFLDEVGDMPLDMQVKLLRVTQDRNVMRVGGQRYLEVDVRIIAATNRDLAVEVREGNFRQDLFYRLNVLPIFIPPLRQRPEDIPLLVTHVLRKLSAKLKKQVLGLSPEVVRSLKNYYWPGNVRELENLLERCINYTDGDRIKVSDLPDSMLGEIDHLKLAKELKPLNEVEQQTVVQALKLAGGNVSQAAKRLGVSRTTIYNKLKKYSIDEKTGVVALQ